MQVPPNSDLTLGMVCLDKAEAGHSVWRMTADERFANPGGVMQGGFLGAFADSSMGAAAVTFVGARKVVAANAEMKISFLAPVPIGAVLTLRSPGGGRRVTGCLRGGNGLDGRGGDGGAGQLHVPVPRAPVIVARAVGWPSVACSPAPDQEGCRDARAGRGTGAK